MSDAGRLSRGKSAVLGLVTAVVITIATLLLLEGSASLYLFSRDWLLARPPSVAVRPHTVHDTLLGWVNEPGYAKPDEYGPGIGLTFTAQGARANGAAALGDASSRATVVCSGDSYTLGAGVADDRHWCGLLERLVPGIRTVNFGEAAYGLDQSWLRYRRDGVPLAPRVHVLAITESSLERSVDGSLDGWSKPYLTLESGKVSVRNVPLPAQDPDALRRVAASRAVDELRVVQEVRRFRGYDRPAAAAAAADERLPLFERAIDELAAADRARGGTLMLVYLPTGRTARRVDLVERRQRLAAIAQQRGIPFIDLTPRLHALRADSLDLTFITRPGPTSPAGQAGQYSRLGHELIARAIAGELATLPALATSRGDGSVPPAASGSTAAR